MTKSADSAGTAQSNPPANVPSESSETVPPFEVNREAGEKPSAAQPEKLFSLFAQALFSAPSSATPPATPSAPNREDPSSPPLVAAKLKALVVGFSDVELNPLCFLLGSLKFDTATATSGEQALEMLTVHPVAVLVMNWDSPETQALTLAQAVRKLSVEQPLILGLATQLTETLRLSAKGTGLDRFYEKPLSQDLLLDCLKENGFAVAEPSP